MIHRLGKIAVAETTLRFIQVDDGQKLPSLTLPGHDLLPQGDVISPKPFQGVGITVPRLGIPPLGQEAVTLVKMRAGILAAKQVF